MAYGRNIFDEAALQQSFDTPVLAGSHTRTWTRVRCSVCEEPCASKHVLRKHKPAIWRAFFWPSVGGDW